jgi:nucleoid-associated protein YgaU
MEGGSLDKQPVSFSRHVVSKPEYDGMKINVAQEGESSVHPGETTYIQSVHSSDGVQAVAALKGHEDRAVLERRATIAMAGENSTSMRAVKEGESLSQITMETYGSQSEKYMEWVKQHNPKIVNPDVIFPGQTIMLPEYRKNKGDQ